MGPFKAGTTAASFPGLTNKGNLEMISEVKTLKLILDLYKFHFKLLESLGLVASNVA